MKKIYTYAGLGIIALMFLSIPGYAFLQSTSFATTQTTTPQVPLPNTNIIDYQLSSQQENALLQQGKTILAFSYSLNCQDCTVKKNLVESFLQTGPFASQLFLEELTTNQTSSTLTISSGYGQQHVTNITSTEITSVLCQLVYQPPVQCVLNK